MRFAEARFATSETSPTLDIGGDRAVDLTVATTVDVGEPCSCPICTGALEARGEPASTQPQYGLNADQRGETGPNSKPSYTVAEAAAQLTRNNTSWNGSNVLGQAATVTFAFRDTAPATMPNGTAGFSAFNAQQIGQTLLALQSWSDVANVTFNRVGTGTTGAGAYSEDAQMLFGNYNSGASGAAAFAYGPGGGNTSVGGDSWYNVSQANNANPAYLNYGRLTLTHEIGHAIGISHPGTYNAGSGQTITYANSAVYYEDSRQYSVMSYFSETNTGASFGGFSGAAPMLDDIAAAQRLYGANTTTRTGDTTYGFNSNTGRDFYAATSATSPVIFAAWDAGGVDTFDFSGYTQAQRVDLNAGAFSDVGGLRGNVAIALGVTIERALGGSGADTLLGNTAANFLGGNGGNDALDGGAGDDTLRGGQNDDTLTGGVGADRLYGDEGRDVLTGGAGADVFLYDQFGVSAPGAATRDVITDFTRGEDLIDLSAAGGTSFIGAAAFSGTAGQIRGVQSGAVTLVELDRNGDRVADLEIELTGALQLAASDFGNVTAPPPPPPPPPPQPTTTLVKPGSQIHATMATAISLNAYVGLASDPNVTNSATAPHATVKATASGQAEWYKFTVSRTGQVTLDIDGGTFDTHIYLYNSAGRLLASNDDARSLDAGSTSSLDSFLAYNAASTGEYFVRVVRYNSSGTTQNGQYTLHVSVPPAAAAAASAFAGDDPSAAPEVGGLVIAHDLFDFGALVGRIEDGSASWAPAFDAILLDRPDAPASLTFAGVDLWASGLGDHDPRYSGLMQPFSDVVSL